MSWGQWGWVAAGLLWVVTVEVRLCCLRQNLNRAAGRLVAAQNELDGVQRELLQKVSR